MILCLWTFWYQILIGARMRTASGVFLLLEISIWLVYILASRKTEMTFNFATDIHYSVELIRIMNQ